MFFKNSLVCSIIIDIIRKKSSITLKLYLVSTFGFRNFRILPNNTCIIFSLTFPQSSTTTIKWLTRIEVDSWILILFYFKYSDF
jgi:hypothetical protein